MEVAILYVVMMLDTWYMIFITVAAISMIVGFIAGSAYLFVPPGNRNEEVIVRRVYKVVRFSFYTFACTMILLFITPTTKQGMVLVASGAVIEAAKTETAQRIAGKSVAVVEKALDELLADKKEKK